MVTLTTAKDLQLVANSSFVGTWDVPTNSNWSIVDAALGQIVNIPRNNSPVTLSAAQFQCYQITFSSTLTGSVAITFPSTFTGPYSVNNICTGSSAFIITLKTTIAGGQIVACPPGELVDVVNDGTNLKFRNLGRVGSYMDYAGSSVPAWIAGCTVPPYLNCDGTAFSSVTYPALAIVLNGTTLPDARGRGSVTLNQTTSRITTANSNLDGDTILATGGTGTTTTLVSTQIPQMTATVTSCAALYSGGSLATTPGGTVFLRDLGLSPITATVGTSNNSAFNPLLPTYVSGIRLIRAA